VNGLLALRTQVERSLKSMGVTGELKLAASDDKKTEASPCPSSKSRRINCQRQPLPLKWKRCSRTPPRRRRRSRTRMIFGKKPHKNTEQSLQVRGYFASKKRENLASSRMGSKKICVTIMPALGHGAMAAHRPLEPWILVRIQVPQPLLFRQDLMRRHYRTNPVFVCPAHFLLFLSRCAGVR
jgi:hypothetical protein